MENLTKFIQKLFIFEKEPQKIGLSQFKEPVENKKSTQPSLRNKNIKLSDLMRGEVIK